MKTTIDESIEACRDAAHDKMLAIGDANLEPLHPIYQKEYLGLQEGALRLEKLKELANAKRSDLTDYNEGSPTEFEALQQRLKELL